MVGMAPNMKLVNLLIELPPDDDLDNYDTVDEYTLRPTDKPQIPMFSPPHHDRCVQVRSPDANYEVFMFLFILLKMTCSVLSKIL